MKSRLALSRLLFLSIAMTCFSTSSKAQSNASDQNIQDERKNVYIFDRVHNKIEMIPAIDGVYFGQKMTAEESFTVAGTGDAGSSGDGHDAQDATLNSPTNITVDSSGNIYFSETDGKRRMIVAESFARADGTTYISGFIYSL